MSQKRIANFSIAARFEMLKPKALVTKFASDMTEITLPNLFEICLVKTAAVKFQKHLPTCIHFPLW